MSLTDRKKNARKRQKQLGRTYGGVSAHPVLNGLALPEDATGKEARLTLLGREKLLVENCRGIAEVREERVRLLVRGGFIIIEGDALHLRDVQDDGVCVCGRLRALLLPSDAPEAPDA